MDITKELPTVISFCSGYGGIERGLDLAGVEHRVIAYVEIEAFAIANLVNKMEAGQLPPAPIYTNLKTFPAHLFRDRVDLITGGYPCQPFSAAGKRLGEDDPRHLWPFIKRHVQTIRPVQCFFENVEGHISLGLSTVISDLEEDGYRATWGIFSAREVGAPHQRKRVYILGNSKHNGPSSAEVRGGACSTSNNTAQRQDAASKFERTSQLKSDRDIQESDIMADTKGLQCNGGSKLDLANSNSIGLEEHGHFKSTNVVKTSENVANSNSTSWQRGSLPSGNGVRAAATQQWLSEPRLGRVVDGCADRVDRLRLLGNGVVPQTAAKAYLTLTTRFL